MSVWTQSDRDRLVEAIASGVRRLRLGGHDTEFQDLAEMRSLLAEMNSDLDAGATPSHRYAVISKDT